MQEDVIHELFAVFIKNSVLCNLSGVIALNILTGSKYFGTCGTIQVKWNIYP